MTELVKIFKNEQFGNLSVIIIKEEPWFIAKEITGILGYKDSEAMTRRLDFDEKMLLTIDIAKSLQIVGFDIPTRGMTIVNESGLYSAIIGSSKEEAKPFKRWITSELLPTIRKTGGFVANEDLFINTYLPFADDLTKQMFGGILATVRNQNETIAKQKKENSKLLEENNHQHKIIDTMTENYDGTYIRTICVDYLNKFSAKSGRDRGELYGDIYKLLGRSLKTDIYYQHEKYIKEQRELVKTNIQYNKEHNLKGSDRREPFLIKHSKAEISKIEYVCDILGKGNAMLEAMSKVFEIGIVEIVNKYNLIKETEGEVI